MLILIFKHQGEELEGLSKEHLEITHKENLFLMGVGSMCVVWVHTHNWDCGYGRGLTCVCWHSQVVEIKLHSVLQNNPKQWM